MLVSSSSHQSSTHSLIVRLTRRWCAALIALSCLNCVATSADITAEDEAPIVSALTVSDAIPTRPAYEPLGTSKPVPAAEFYLEHAGSTGEIRLCADNETPAVCAPNTQCSQCCKKHFHDAQDNEIPYASLTQTQKDIVQNNCLQDHDGLVTVRGVYEAQAKYYATISAPPASGPNPAGWNGSPPQTLQAWLQRFQFPTRQAGESEQAFRDRAGYVTYYNHMELGLGRLLGCSQFLDGFNGNTPLIGYACFVTNFGAHFYEAKQSVQKAMAGAPARNTVTISFRPSQPVGYQVQFWAYGSDGYIIYSAQLDPHGQRTMPLICTSCHGGRYVANETCRPTQKQFNSAGISAPYAVTAATYNPSMEDTDGGDADCGGALNSCSCRNPGTCTSGGTCAAPHRASLARFLPLNTRIISFADDLGVSGVPVGATRAGQEERIRRINEIATRTPLTTDQLAFVSNLYNGNVASMNAVQDATTYPSAWSDPAFSTVDGRVIAAKVQQDLWENVALPYCGTCHLAIKPVKSGDSCGCGADQTVRTDFSMSSYESFRSYFERQGFGAICDDYHMPHAVPTQKAFWENPAVINGVTYATARQALFAGLKMQCDDYHTQGTCESAASCVWNVQGLNGTCGARSGFWNDIADCGRLVNGVVQTPLAQTDTCLTRDAQNNIDYDASDRKCETVGGRSEGGYICGLQDAAYKCVPGCRIQHPTNALGDINAPYRGCGTGYACRADDSNLPADVSAFDDCVACGRPGQPACNTTESQGGIGGACSGGAVIDGTNCVSCTTDTHCAGNAASSDPNQQTQTRCDVTAKVCVQCTSAAQCGGGQTCQANRCVTLCDFAAYPYTGCSSYTQTCGAENTCLDAPTLYPYQSIEDRFASQWPVSKTYRLQIPSTPMPSNWKTDVWFDSAASNTGFASRFNLTAKSAGNVLLSETGNAITLLKDTQYLDTQTANSGTSASFNDSTLTNHRTSTHSLGLRTTAGATYYVTVSGFAYYTQNNGYFTLGTSRPQGTVTAKMPYYSSVVGEADGSSASHIYSVVADSAGVVDVQLDQIWSSTTNLSLSLQTPMGCGQLGLFPCATTATIAGGSTNRETLRRTGLTPGGTYQVVVTSPAGSLGAPYIFSAGYGTAAVDNTQ